MTSYGSDPMERRQHVEKRGGIDDPTLAETSHFETQRDRHSDLRRSGCFSTWPVTMRDAQPARGT